MFFSLCAGLQERYRCLRKSLSSLSLFSFFLDGSASSRQVGFKVSFGSKKKKNRHFSKLLRSSLVSSKPGSFDSAERERERERERRRRTRSVLVLVFLFLFL